jgi:non-ribosomal peptide synthetase component F/thioesterase domain-containing protein/acyl carrier protein
MAEPNRSELYAVEEAPLNTPNGVNGHSPSGHHSAATDVPADSGQESTFVFPASREQTRYWMLAQLDPSSTASNMAISFDIEGALDDHAAEAAIAALTLRHEALRTLFRLENGVLSQVVLERPLYAFAVKSLAALPSAEREAAASESVSQHGHTLIDLHDGPVLHAQLIHLDDRHHIMALTMNHIVCDGWSNGILIRDFTLLYESILAKREPVLPELPFQFADFSLWQNEYLESPAAAEASAFWKQHITADMPALDMPTDAPRTSGRSFPGHIESALLPKEIDDRLKDYCRKSGSTKHIVLLAAFEALCARYTGQKEFLLGSTIANRTQPGMEDVVGRFANPQIIVARVDGDPTFAELEQRVREWETAAYLHQDLPFSRIIEDFQIDQAGATSQFLQVWFLYQKAFMQPQQGETIRVTPRRSVSGGVDFDVLVSIVERAEGPRIQMEYNTLLFKPERIRGLIESFTQLLGEGLRDPSLPISRLAVATENTTPASVLAAVTVGDVATDAVPVADTLSIVDRVRAQAGRVPDDVVVDEATRRLTWRDLDERSSAVAADLLRKGADESSTLVIPLAPQFESVIALLAAIKTGAQVLPLPAHATAAAIAELLPKLSHAMLTGPADGFAGLPAAPDFEPREPGPLLLLTDAEHAVYEKTSLARIAASLDAVMHAIGLQRGEALLAFAPARPVDACLDLLLALASGSQISFAGDTKTHPIETQLAQHQVTRLLLSPGDLKGLAAANWQGDRRVSLVVRGGRLPAPLPGLLPRNTKSAIYLLSTPGSGFCAYQVLTSQEGLLPLAGSLAIQGPDGQPLPNGAFGELHLMHEAGTDGVGLGFMARSTTTGAIELLDAPDRFMQLRGHRICLGDIEDALFPQLQLADALAAVPEGDQRLVAYLVCGKAIDSPHDKRSQVIRQHLSSTLPSHLVPSEYIWLDALPRTLDGRVDITLLPKAEAPAATPARSHGGETNSALTVVEEKLANIWKDVLGLRQIDIHKQFFDLGGSSLLLVRLFARINKAFDTSLPITTIFDAQTIAELARTLGGSTEISPLVQVQPHGSQPPLFMIHSYLLYKGLSTSLGPDQPFFGLRELDRDGNLTIEERVRHYVREIRRVQPQGPYHLAGWCAAGPLTVEVARQLLLADQKVNYLALFDSWLPGYIESIEAASPKNSWLPYRTVSSKLAFHRSKMRGLTVPKKFRYLWLAAARIAKESRDRIYLANWERVRNLSKKYQFALPQFMHNTSLDTFSALKDYREQRIPVRITLIRASDSREIQNAAPSCGWERIADNGVEVLWAPGDHETMFVGDNLRVTAEIVQNGLTAAGQAVTTTPNAAGEASSLRGTTLHVDCPST